MQNSRLMSSLYFFCGLFWSFHWFKCWVVLSTFSDLQLCGLFFFLQFFSILLTSMHSFRFFISFSLSGKGCFLFLQVIGQTYPGEISCCLQAWVNPALCFALKKRQSWSHLNTQEFCLKIWQFYSLWKKSKFSWVWFING